MRSESVRCPNPTCRAVLSIPQEVQGQEVRCAACGHSFVVPPPGLTLGGGSRQSAAAPKRARRIPDAA